ncbi:hypothetical protein DFH07DRAFT_120483 [Mycena maculata]|uniref:Uncharacterized protein n=1 Tax=Mycena maculata TaxID=230809 RepID=A0AAD7NT68_9AGAR|nr:hypothetical protein DFH07DRAFT_120483 [Mycena maculata]
MRRRTRWREIRAAQRLEGRSWMSKWNWYGAKEEEAGGTALRVVCAGDAPVLDVVATEGSGSVPAARGNPSRSLCMSPHEEQVRGGRAFFYARARPVDLIPVFPFHLLPRRGSPPSSLLDLSDSCRASATQIRGSTKRNRARSMHPAGAAGTEGGQVDVAHGGSGTRAQTAYARGRSPSHRSCAVCSRTHCPLQITQHAIHVDAPL